MNQFVQQVTGILAGLVLLVSTSVASIPQKFHDFGSKFGYKPTNAKTVKKTAQGQTSNPSVLAAVIDRSITGVTFTIPAFFKDLVKLDSSLEVSGTSTFNGKVTLNNQDLDIGTGKLTASNVLYGVKAGKGILVGTGQTPELKLDIDVVSSISGRTGDLTLEEGSGITVDGLEITNSDKGSSQSIFKTIAVSGQSNIAASSNTDTLTFVAGSGITLTTDATNKKLTVTNSLDPGWVDDGTTVRLSTSTDSIGIGTSSPSSKIHLVGGDFRLGTGTFDNASSNEDLYVTGNIELDGTLYGNITGTSIDAGLGLGAVAFQGASGFAGNPSQLYWDNSSNRLGIGSSSPSAKLYVAGTGIFTNSLSATSLDLGGGGITNAGAIVGGTGFTSTGTITFGSLSAGIAHLSAGGVLSSSAVNLANSDVTGTLGTTTGGTGLTSYTTGDLLYGSATNVLSKLGVGSSGQVLTVSNGLPAWATITGGSGGLCPNCVVTDPGSSQTIAPTGSSTVGLIVKQTSTGGGSPDIFKVTSSDGATAYLRVDSTGSVVLGSGASSSGTFTVNPSGYDPISISPVSQGSGAFTGTITSADLTAARTWTLPNATGSICLDTGNCAGSGGNLGGSGTANYLARWNAQYTLENGTLYDNGNIGIGTSAPLAKLDTLGTAWLRGSTSTTGLYVASSGNVGIGTTGPSYTLDVVGTGNVSGAATLGSTLNVTGATTLSSTANITGTTTIGSVLQVNGTGNSYIMGNLGIGTSSPSSTLSFGSAATVGLATSTRALNIQSGLLDLDTSNSRVGVGTTAPQATFETASNSLSSGIGLLVSSTSTSFSSGKLASIDWSPSSATTATGDVLSVNVGANGVVGNIFNVMDGGSSVFSVSQSQITAGLPINFQSPGDVGIAYDLLFTNQTASNIKSYGPLAIESGESFESNYLTLRTFNSGQLVFDTPGGLLLAQTQRWSLQSSAQALIIADGLMGFDTTNSRIGIGTSNPLVGFDVHNTAWLRGAAGGASGVYVNSSGNVGIGSTAPLAGLDVNGTAWLRGVAGGSSGLYVNGSGNIGIGVTSPKNKLDVSGSVAFGSLPTTALPQSNSAYFSGSVGIGTTNPSYALDVRGTLGATGNVTIGGNNSTLSVSGVASLSLSSSQTAFNVSSGLFNIDTANSRVGIGTTAPTTKLQIVGGDCSDDAGGGGCTADYAELYPSSENVEKGDVLSIDSADANVTTVKRSSTEADARMIGIVSSAPAAIADGSKLTFMNTNYVLDPRKPAVALTGRVPVKIASDSQPIKAGDALTSSAQVGKATKATHAGAIIGKALESWNPGGKDKIIVFVNTSWFDPGLVLGSNGEVKGALSTMANVSPENTDLIAQDLAKISGQFNDLAFKVDSLDSALNGVKGSVEQLTADKESLTARLATMEDKLVQLEHNGVVLGIGSSNPQLSTDSLASASATLTDADSLISGTESKLSELTVTGLTKLNNLNVIGDATFGMLQILGIDSNGGSNIDTITGPLRLQATALNDLDIMNGKVLISKEGNIVTKGEITAKKLNISTEKDAEDSSIGTAVLASGTKKIVVKTKAVTEKSHVFVTPKGLIDYPLVVTVLEPQTSFTVEVKSAEDADVEFDWFIVN